MVLITRVKSGSSRILLALRSGLTLTAKTTAEDRDPAGAGRSPVYCMAPLVLLVRSHVTKPPGILMSLTLKPCGQTETLSYHALVADIRTPPFLPIEA